VGDNAVMVIDTQATPVMAQDVIRRIREVTDKPIRYVVLSHYHAVRVLGASAYGADHVISSRDTLRAHSRAWRAGHEERDRALSPLVPRGRVGARGSPGPISCSRSVSRCGSASCRSRSCKLGRGHTKGDTVVWLPQEKILFSGDLVEYEATPYTGDAYLAEWPDTLDNIAALKPLKLVPGRGAALMTPEAVKAGLEAQTGS
jgi:glyoxylase-like metal-dependent hydrolase (beta-lactamase superfamily II)